MVKFLFLKQFPVDHLSHSVMYYRLVFITTQPTLAILLRIIDFGCDIIGPYGFFFFLFCYKMRFNFSLMVSLSWPYMGLLVADFANFVV